MVRGKGRKGDKTGQKPSVFNPPKWGWAYIGSCVDLEVKPCISARCDATGISRNTFYKWYRKPEFVVWVNAQVRSLAAYEAAQVRSFLVHRAMRGDLRAIELYLRLYEGGTMRHLDTRHELIAEDRELADALVGEYAR